MLNGLRTFVIGYHNPIVHTYYVCQSWRKIFKSYPKCREFICILLHDIGYIKQNGTALSEKNDVHPLLGATICGLMFGAKYYNLCAGHSRDYAKKTGIDISPLCYADKHAVILMPLRIHKIIKFFDNNEAFDIINVKKLYLEWWNENGWDIKTETEEKKLQE